ncbi:hypothetical protein [Acinetobacter baumannii]|uniref:hypothetical protein n=1 Tax=Acinetobacter baumannii TaxID=470 RepID=UPI0010C81B1F|nr:hypothetical protein [Acinetobacter baumannii]NDW80032.1 hypothetical protein [Acinetobacter baumannii]NDW97845.1 hypothetical protein [Acinetobacter baumannii]QCP22421.1 hypothetical protein FDF35_01270 [Acinetobacter baumannii]
MDKPITFSEWLGTQGNMVLLHANCCRIAFEGGQQSMQAKVEELQTLYTQQGINMLKMQKRLEELESLLEKIHRYGLDSYNTSTCLTIRDELEQALKGGES